MTTTIGVAAASLTALGAIGLGAAAATAASVTIDPPGAVTAGTVDLTGTVGADPGEVTSVLYVFDATMSTSAPTGADCSGTGGLGPEDDLNADRSVGDILDCEIAGVAALNRSLASAPGVQVGLVAFANEAAVADLDPSGSATFVPPGYTGGDARPRIDTVASSVVRTRIGLYDPKELGGSGSGTAFNSAVSTALATLGSAPAGPKWIMFLSDGQAAVSDDVLAQLGASGVRLRSFGMGADASCEPWSSLHKMAAATGEACQRVTDPASLVAGLTGTPPDAVQSVSVSIADVAVAATVNAVGGWKARFTLGAGTYTATARATMTSGTVRTTQRTFTVAPAAPGSQAPAPGTVAPGPGALKATAVRVDRPRPTRDVLPSRVAGRVGRPVDGLQVVRALSGATVLLQARADEGGAWTSVDRGKVDRDGRFVLKWRPKSRFRLLRVVLRPSGNWATSAATVPTPAISACKVKGGGSGWAVTCRTTVKRGSVARLVEGGAVVDRSRVKRGSLRLSGKGAVKGHVIEVGSGKRRVRLAL